MDASVFAPCTSPTAYSFLTPGSHSFRVRAIDQAGNVDPSPALRTWTISATGPKLLIADLRNRRLLITDFDGRLIWKFDNPTGRDHIDSGPLGVRWMPGNQILATFGTGEVGLIDVATKTWVWKTSGYGGDWFQSPYDAEILPDGNLAVATRYNEGGRISVYDRSTGKVVWKHLLSNAHSVKFRTAEQSYQTNYPTLLVGGWGSVREVAYRPNGGQNVTWNVRTEFTHDAIVVENDQLLTTEGYYIQKITRQGGQVWRHSTPDENRRIAVNPSGGYIYTVAEADKVEFRNIAGTLLRQWSAVSDGSTLDYPYGLQVIDFTG
jgi:DNA-binding beta-propeller fold protein YncE